MQFNGVYGCGYCEQSGDVIGTDKGGNVTTFPFMSDDPQGPKRTKEKCIVHAQQAVHQKSVVSSCRVS